MPLFLLERTVICFLLRLQFLNSNLTEFVHSGTRNFNFQEKIKYLFMEGFKNKLLNLVYCYISQFKFVLIDRLLEAIWRSRWANHST